METQNDELIIEVEPVDNKRREYNVDTVNVNDDSCLDGIDNIEVFKAQSIIAKQRRRSIQYSWVGSQEDLLFTWSEKGAVYRWLHIRAHEYYTYMNNLYTYPIIVLSSVIGFSGMVLNKPHLSETDLIILYILSSCNLIVAMLSSVQKFNKHAEKAEHHLSQSIQYAKFYRDINMELSLDRKDRENGVVFCKNSQSKYDNLLGTSLSVPRHIIREFNLMFPNLMNRPDIANGLFDMNIKKRIYDKNALTKTMTINMINDKL
jgi:hypothetical protein